MWPIDAMRFSNSRPPCAVRSTTEISFVNPLGEDYVHNVVHNAMHVIFREPLDESNFDVSYERDYSGIKFRFVAVMNCYSRC